MEDKFKRFKESLRSHQLKTQQEEILAKVLTPEQIESRTQFLKEHGKSLFDKSDQVISYERMPQGLKESQEKNDVRDHGLGLFDRSTRPKLGVNYGNPSYDNPLINVKYIKGDFKLIADAVIFEESQEGVFTIGDPANLNDAAKNFLDRKFPGIPYLHRNNIVYMPKSIIEPEVFMQMVGFEPLQDNPVEKPMEVISGVPNQTGIKSTLKLHFGQSKKEEMTEKVEAYKETKARIIEKENESVEDHIAAIKESAEFMVDFGLLEEAYGHPNPAIEVKGFEPEDNIRTDLVLMPPFPGTTVPEKAKPKFGRAKFAKKPLAEGEVAKNKINASKIEEHGIVFDSKIENFMYNLLNEEKIRFEFQKEFVLQEGFVYMHENILPVKIIIDFFLLDYPVMADTKGMMMDHTKIKHKMLKKLLHDQGNEYRIVLPSSQKKCRELIHMLRNGFVVEDQLTEHAANARKTKLKKHGFEWVDGFWVKDPLKHSAIHIMNLPKYDFEELLLASKPKEIEDPNIAFCIYNACVAVHKNYNYEVMMYSDYMNGKEGLLNQVWNYVMEIEQFGTEAFKQKYKGYDTYYI